MNLLHPQETGPNEHARTEEIGLPAGEDGFAGLKVLLVEDNAVNQQIAREILSEAGLDVSVADNGQIALDLLKTAGTQKAPFALVLMDLQMPVMDGLEATRRIRELDAAWAKDLPVIAMTAHSRDSELQACRAAGLDDHVSKPISVSELFASIRRWLPPEPVPDSGTGVVRGLYDKARRGDSSVNADVIRFERLLEASLHQGRMERLNQLLRADDLAGVAAFLERLGGVMGFMDR